jgi:very-short-patch-repair endonuclease
MNKIDRWGEIENGGGPKTPLFPEEGCPQGGVVAQPPPRGGEFVQVKNYKIIKINSYFNVLKMHLGGHLMERIHNLIIYKDRRKALRNALTPAEAALWIHLSDKKLEGRKFRRQHGVGYYILDFYCPSENLAIELDGAPHFTPEGVAYDEKRTAYLTSRGIRVIRFENETVFKFLEQVLEEIRRNFRS